MLQSTKVFFSSVLLFSVLVISPHAHAILLIDNFTDFQSVTDSGALGSTSSAPLTLTVPAASALSGIQRTLTSEATGGGFGSQEILVGEPGGPGTGGILAISNNTFSTGTATITWDGFGPTDFTASANAMLLEVIAIDLNVNVEMIVNGGSTSGLQPFAGPGNFFVNFASFTDPTAFNAASQLQLKFTGPEAWDGQFRLLAAQTPTEIPEPATLLLIGLGFLGLSFAKKRVV